MAWQVTENWSARQLGLRSARRQWVIWEDANVGTPSGALAQLQILAPILSSHPDNPILLVSKDGIILSSQEGPRGPWVGEARYEIASQSVTDPEDDVVTISFQLQQVDATFDRDIDLKPLVNTAGDSVPQVKRVWSLMFAITRMENRYNINTAEEFIGSCNTNPVSVFGFGTVPARKLRCNGIVIASEISVDAPTFPIRYEFEMMPRSALASGWDREWRVLDEGYRGWYTKDGVATLGDFYTNGVDRTSEPVRLNGQGKPIVTSIKVAVDNAPIVAPRHPAWADITGDDDAKFLNFRTTKTEDFARLDLFP